jgi:cytochrome P450
VNDFTQLDIVSLQFKANPFPVLANLRASRPVYSTTLPDKTPVWLLIRYEDVATLLKDERFVKHKRKAMTAE